MQRSHYFVPYEHSSLKFCLIFGLNEVLYGFMCSSYARSVILWKTKQLKFKKNEFYFISLEKCLYLILLKVELLNLT